MFGNILMSLSLYLLPHFILTASSQRGLISLSQKLVAWQLEVIVNLYNDLIVMCAY